MSGKRKGEDTEHKSSTKRKDFFCYRRELEHFLYENVNVRKPEDFWNFYEKYTHLQSLKKEAFDRNKLVAIGFNAKTSELYEKLPVLDKNGQRFSVRYSDFKDFLTSIKVYQDFQQKSKFAKLKNLRKTQRELPIFKFKEEIIAKVAENKVVLIAGDTGCGKSTQVPQYILEAGFKKVVCTQPRRIACVSLSKRVSHETLTDFKSTVGYQIRFERTKNKSSSIIFMTEGLLLRQASDEELLNSYDVIILDEVHERHLHCDFLIGIMKCLLNSRNNFKLILMSATINIELFSSYFAAENVEVIRVPGRLYPIKIHYKPIIRDPYEKKRDRFDCTPYLQIVQMIDDKFLPSQKGDMLIFVNGFAEIETLASAIEEYAERKRNWIVLRLHSSLSLEEQDKVFDYPPDGVRKCVVSTNIAETSVTIDGVRFVIDSGKVNRMVYNTNGGVNKLSACNISQDSAKQRAGRAGRTGPGECFRMYSEKDFESFEPFTPPEILLVPLESLLLQMIGLGLKNIAHFPFLEAPSTQSIEESLEKLKFSGALAPEKDCLIMTSLGETLTELPVDIQIGKMLIMATVFKVVDAILTLAALMSVQNPINQNSYNNSEAYELRKPLESSHGDPITLLKLFKEWLEIKQSFSEFTSQKNRPENSRVWARKRCIEEQRFYETVKLIEQFRGILTEAGLLEKIAEPNLSSGERAIRYGELKNLKSMRVKLRNESRVNKRKVLKPFECDSDDVPGPSNELRDVEFRITNNFSRIQQLLDHLNLSSYKTLMLLKLVLSSGLYPQIAVEDELNSSKTVADHLYHTKTKNYIFLRPNSYFATNPEILELHNDDIEIPPPGYFSKRPISAKHQILVFQSMLETKKVYLLNVMRMPALQTLLLFAKTIATNSTITQIIFDDFLRLDLPYFGQGKNLLKRAIELREKWKEMLEIKLQKPCTESNEDEIASFIEDLLVFMQTQASYNIKRLLPADLKLVYTRSPQEITDETQNPFLAAFKMTPNAELGGCNVTENVVYDCLIPEQWTDDLEINITTTGFECPNCSQTHLNTPIFKIFQHEAFCQKLNKITITQENVATSSKNNKNCRNYQCPNCNLEITGTPIEILRHKKACVVSKVENNT